MKLQRIWILAFVALLFVALLSLALRCAAQESLPRREETPSANASATPTPIPEKVLGLIPPPAGKTAPPPNMPDLSQLDQIFKQTGPGKEAIEYRAHVEWRQLRNRTTNDPAVVSAKAAAEAATTDLEKRNRLRIYYETFYARMRALASTPEMVAYLDSMKKGHLGLLDQPRVRPTPEISPKPETSPSPSPESSPIVLPQAEDFLPNK
jgi:hypothetical protein